MATLKIHKSDILSFTRAYRSSITCEHTFLNNVGYTVKWNIICIVVRSWLYITWVAAKGQLYIGAFNHYNNSNQPVNTS